jgi:hypothetical protein
MQNENGADRNTALQDVADAAVDMDTRTRTREELESSTFTSFDSPSVAALSSFFGGKRRHVFGRRRRRIGIGLVGLDVSASGSGSGGIHISMWIGEMWI